MISYNFGPGMPREENCFKIWINKEMIQFKMNKNELLYINLYKNIIIPYTKKTKMARVEMIKQQKNKK